MKKYYFQGLSSRIDPKTKRALVPISSIRDLCSTKEELYKIFVEEGGYYLPPLSKTTNAFLKDILTNKKSVLLKKNVSKLDERVPHYPELSIKTIWPLIKSSQKDLLVYFPDYAENQYPDKTFTLNILNTEMKEKLETLINKAKEIRKEMTEEKAREEEKYMDIGEEFLKMFKKSDKKTKKNGTLSDFMKKIRKPRKPRRKKFETKLISWDNIQVKKNNLEEELQQEAEI